MGLTDHATGSPAPQHAAAPNIPLAPHSPYICILNAYSLVDPPTLMNCPCYFFGEGTYTLVIIYEPNCGSMAVGCSLTSFSSGTDSWRWRRRWRGRGWGRALCTFIAHGFRSQQNGRMQVDCGIPLNHAVLSGLCKLQI